MQQVQMISAIVLHIVNVFFFSIVTCSALALRAAISALIERPNLHSFGDKVQDSARALALQHNSRNKSALQKLRPSYTASERRCNEPMQRSHQYARTKVAIF
jgi:hypothetical protein